MKRFKFIPFVVLFLVLTLTIGFSAMNKNLMMRDIGAQIRIEKDIRVTGITPNGSTSNGLAMSEDYNVSNITPSLSLPNQDSTVSSTVEVTNFGNVEMGIANVTGCPSNLVCEVSGYTMTEPICDTSGKCKLGAVKSFDVTVKYASGAYDANNTSFDLLLEFDDYNIIVDYKLKNTQDDAYLKQLDGYKTYIEKITNKKTITYLYSIIDGQLVKIKE